MTAQNLLASVIERWLQENQKRTIGRLGQITGVDYQVIKRSLQKESIPTPANALALLNTCATIEETLDYFKDNPAILNFQKRIASSWKLCSESEFISKLTSKNSCLIVILALTVGATHESVMELLGRYGLAEFNSLVDDGFLKEHHTKPGVFVVDPDKDLQLRVENIEVGMQVAEVFATIPTNSQSLARFFASSVNLETYQKVKEIEKQAYTDIAELVKNSDGPYVMCGALTLTILNYQEDK